MLILFAAAAILSAALTYAIIPVLVRAGSVADPNSRTMHSGRIPKGGGLAVLGAGALVLGLIGQTSLPPPAVIGGTVLLAILSWRDDVSHVPAGIRLVAHLAIASWFVMTLPGDALAFQGLLPFAADRAATVIALAWMMNLYNFMDGINGITSAETVAIAVGYLAVGAMASAPLPYEELAAVLAGACLGFLLWNGREQALVFLGDTGSVPLGFLAGCLMIDLAQRGYWIAALALPAYFVADATLTLIRRIASGAKPWEAHRSHAYQRAAQVIGAHLPVVGMIAVANAVLVGVAVLSVSRPALALVVLFCAVAGVLLALERAARSRSSDSGP